MNPNEKAELARELFLSGSNCAQSVYAAFAEDMGMSRERALLLSSGLGGGLGGLRFTCGAFTAMVMVLSALRGYTDGADLDGKKRLYAQVQQLHERFVEKYGLRVPGTVGEKRRFRFQRALGAHARVLQKAALCPVRGLLRRTGSGRTGKKLNFCPASAGLFLDRSFYARTRK